MKKSRMIIATVFLYSLGIQAVFSQALSNAIRFRLTNTSSGYYDETVIRFQAGASANYDGSYDAFKIFSINNSVPALYTKSGEGYDLSVNAYPGLDRDYSLDVHALTPTSDSFSLEYEIIGAFDANTGIYLEDLVSGGVYSPGPDFPVTFYATASASANVRFRVHFSLPAAGEATQPSCSATHTGKAVISDPGNPNFSYTLFDSAGVVVSMASGVAEADTLTGLARGAYLAITYSPYGVSDSLTFVIDAFEEIQFEGTITHVSAKGLTDGAIDLTVHQGMAPFTFDWFDGYNTEDRTGLSAGEYRVQITDDASCAKQVAFMVEEPDTQAVEPPASIELLDFTATNLQDSAVKLEWRTAFEYLNDYFAVERSGNGIAWTQVALVDGVGISASVSDYEGIDPDPLPGTAYYRLKQVDLLGAVFYSETLSVQIQELPPVSADPKAMELLLFTAAITPGGEVELQWITTAEYNNDYFTVERSGDNEQWEAVHHIPGSGTSADTLTYGFVDRSSLEGGIYYRLKQTGFSGTSSYSDVVFVENRTNATPGLKVYPVPANTELIVEGNNSASVPARITDQFGKTVVLQGENQGTRVTFDIRGLSEGVYFITAGQEDTTATKCFVVTR